MRRRGLSTPSAWRHASGNISVDRDCGERVRLRAQRGAAYIHGASEKWILSDSTVGAVTSDDVFSTFFRLVSRTAETATTDTPTTANPTDDRSDDAVGMLAVSFRPFYVSRTKTTPSAGWEAFKRF